MLQLQININGLDNRLKNHSDELIFQSAICAEASQMCPYRRAKFEIWLAIPTR